MTTGTIKKLVADRGFGFITAEDGKEYFFHRSSIESFDSLRGNERVEFDVEDSPKGPRAAQVRVSTGAPEAAPAEAAPPETVEEAPAPAEAVAEEPAAEQSHEGHDHEGHDHVAEEAPAEAEHSDAQ